MVNSTEKAYTEQEIETTTNLDQIRRRPAGFIGTRDIDGQCHMIREVIDNSVDELILRPEGGTLNIVLFRDTANGKYQLLITDTGRGIPSGALKRATTILGTSGKTKVDGVYRAAGGQFGYGLKAPAALSSKFLIISVNNTETIGSSLYLEDGVEKRHEIEPITDVQYGTRVLFEPDLSFFINGTEFMVSGYLEVIKLCKQLGVFNENINFRFFTVDRLINRSIWNAPIGAALNIIDRIIKDPSKTVEYDASLVADKGQYLFEGVWRNNSSIIFNQQYHKDPISVNDRLGFDIKLYFSRKSTTGNPQYFITINNVKLTDNTGNSATVAFLKAFHQKLLPTIPEKYQEFFETQYRFPTMFLAIGIRYNQAELAGLTKHSFKDSHFAQQFEKELTALFAAQDIKFWETLSQIINADVEFRYAQFYDTPLKKTESKRTFADLNFPQNYKECKSSDPAITELFLVEGSSAANINETRNSETQSIYTTRGKPLNPASDLTKLKENRARLLKDPIYQDILRILNIGPNTKDMSTARFGKLIITSDADPDGAHIRSLHLNNLYIINPLIITSGMVYLANPPLYSMQIDKNKKLFLRDKNALMDARIEYVYSNVFQLQIDSHGEIRDLAPHVFRECCYLIHRLGEQFEILSEQLNIPILILERLALNIDCLFPKLQYDKLKDIFKSSDGPDFIRVQIHPEQKFMVISVGQEDYTIGLDSIGATLHKHIYPLMKKIQFSNVSYRLKSKYKDSQYADWTPMSWMMVYLLMSNLDKRFTIKRYKGLGEMKSDDCYETLMNPMTRMLTHVTSLGDIPTNYALIGRNTPEERKKLLTDTNMLHNRFYKK